MGWKTVSSRTAYENPWIRVREDIVVRPDGEEGLYGVVEVRDSAFVVALDEDDRVLFVTIDRYTTGPASLEIPAGGTDGQDPLVAAQRELLEETGYAAESWSFLGRISTLNGVANAWMNVFLARDLHVVESGATHQAEEGISALAWVPFGEALAMAADGRLSDGETIAALALAGIRLGRFA